MTLNIQHIDDLDPALVLAAQEEMSQLIQEKFPEVEAVRGPIHDLIHFFSGGISGGANQTLINRVLESRSLLAISENPELADPELTDHVLSNFMITRKVGTRARGNMTVVVTGATSVVIAGNSQYSSGGIDFRTDYPVMALTPGSTAQDTTERVLAPRGDGTYEFTVPVTAEAVGLVGNLQAGTKFVPEVTPARFVTAYATNDFTGGTSTEDNTALVQRLLDGIPARVTAGRANITALIKSQPIFADTRYYSYVGCGDAEMTRDQHWIFPGSGGGRVDVYAQTAPLPQLNTLRKTATLLANNGTTTTWQVALEKQDAPGFYVVDTVRRPEDPTDQPGFAVILDQRGWDVTGETWVPDIADLSEAYYTKYQTSVIQFEDTLTNPQGLTPGAQREYLLSVLQQPLIAELQNFLHSQEHRHLSADILVKAAVPCLLSINFTIYKRVTDTAPDIEVIRENLVARINNYEFPGRLYASQVADIVHDTLLPHMALGPVDLHGKILQIGGGFKIIRSTHTLAIPDTPDILTTPNTTIFVLYPNNIGISVVNR